MKNLKIDILVIRNAVESSLIENSLNLLKCDGIISKVIASNDLNSILFKKINPLWFESFDKVWLLKIPSLINLLLIGFKPKRLANEKSTKFEFNPEFTKILTLDKPLEVRLNEYIEIDENNIENYEFITETNAEPNLVTLDNVLNGTPILTIDINKPNLIRVLKSNDINPSKLIKIYHKRGTDNVNIVDLNELRKEYVDRVTFYKVNGFFLLVGYSKKAKTKRRIFEYNNGFVRYITALEDYKIEKLRKKLDEDSAKPISNILNFENKEESIYTNNDKFDDLDPETLLNRILDKIGRTGTKSLTDKEKLFLNDL
jgi:hypothetical protein